ncbi:hypothetical protein VPH35_014873 [Triticum aestivum]
MAKATRRVDEAAARGAAVDPTTGAASEQAEAEARAPHPGWLDGDARLLGLGGSARPHTETEAETSGYVGGSRPRWRLAPAWKARRPAAPAGRRRWQAAWRGVDGGRGDPAQRRR